MKKLYLSESIILELYPEALSGEFFNLSNDPKRTFLGGCYFALNKGDFYLIDENRLAAKVNQSVYEIYQTRAEEMRKKNIQCPWLKCLVYLPDTLLLLRQDLNQAIPELAAILSIDPILLDKSVGSLKMLDDIFSTYYMNCFLQQDTYTLLLAYCLLIIQKNLGDDWFLEVDIPLQEPEKFWKISLFEGVQRFIDYCTNSLNIQTNSSEEDEMLPFL